jgi:hypothetical protein
MARARTRSTAPAPLKDFGMIPLRDQVRAAMPVAHRFLEEGIDYGQRTDDSFMDRVVEFLDDPEFRRFNEHAPDAEASAWADRLEAARAIGIALGLMLRPEAFADGAR